MSGKWRWLKCKGVSGAGGCDIGTFSWAVFFLAKVCAKTFLCMFYDEVALVLSGAVCFCAY